MSDLPGNDHILEEDDTSSEDEMSTEEEGYSHKVLFLRDYCVRCKGVDCARCVAACPKEALSIGKDNAPRIDEDLCTGCGICFGICDAFSSNRVTLIDLHRRVTRIALQGDRVYFTCPENIFPGFEPASNVIVLPCLACLPPEFWTLILSENISATLAFDLTYCADCERAGEIAEVLYSHAIATAEEQTGKKVSFSEIIPEKENVLKDITDPRGVDRRSAFTNLISDVGDVVSGKRRLRNSEVLQQFIERRERSRAIAQLNLGSGDEPNNFVPGGRTRKILFPKRRMLIEAIERDPSIAENIPLCLAEIQQEDLAYLREFTCPTGALYPDPETGMTQLDIVYCIGCGLCVEAYPEGAIELKETTASVFTIVDEAGEDTTDEPSQES